MTIKTHNNRLSVLSLKSLLTQTGRSLALPLEGIVHIEETYNARAFNSLRHEENLVTVWQELNTAPTHYRVNNGGKERRAFRMRVCFLISNNQFSLSQAYSSLEKEIKPKERRREINLVTDTRLAGKQSDDRISLDANGPAQKPHCKNVTFSF